MSLLSKLFWAHDLFTQVSVVVIAEAALFALYFIYLPLLRRLQGVSRLRAHIVRITRSPATEPQSVKEDVASAFQRSLLAEQWGEFIRHWRSSGGAGPTGHAPVRFADAMDHQPAIPRGARATLLHTLPGIFLSLGILGTFIGLTLAIPEAPKDGADGMTKVVSDLAEHLGLAFRTSLWGMSLSMLWLILIRGLEGALEAETSYLDDAVSRVFPWISPAELATQSIRDQQRTFDLLRNEFTNLTSELSNVLANGLQKIEQSTASAASLVSSEQKEAVQQLVLELADTIKQGVGTELKTLGSVIDQTAENQEKIAVGLRQTFGQLEQAAATHAEVLRSLNPATQGLSQLTSTLGEGTRNADQIVRHLDAATQALLATSTSIQKTQETAQQALQTLDAGLRTAGEVVDHQRQIAEASLGEIRAGIETMSRGLGDDLLRALRSIDEILGQSVGRLSGTIHDSNETLDRLTEPINEMHAATGEIGSNLQKIDQTISSLVSRLDTALSPLGESLGNVGGELASAGAAFRETGRQIAEVEEALRGAGPLGDTVRQLSQRLEVVGDRVGLLNSHLGTLDHTARRWATAPPHVHTEPQQPVHASAEAPEPVRGNGHNEATPSGPEKLLDTSGAGPLAANTLSISSDQPAIEETEPLPLEATEPPAAMIGASPQRGVDSQPAAQPPVEAEPVLRPEPPFRARNPVESEPEPESGAEDSKRQPFWKRVFRR